jgi:hypothetical protein
VEQDLAGRLCQASLARTARIYRGHTTAGHIVNAAPEKAVPVREHFVSSCPKVQAMTTSKPPRNHILAANRGDGRGAPGRREPKGPSGVVHPAAKEVFVKQSESRQSATPDPKKQFSSPEILMADKKLSTAEKRKLLEQWKQDLTLEHTATQENMPVQQADGTPAPSSGDSADLLQRVSNSLRKVSEQDHANPSPRVAPARRH